jgi:acetyl esterase/lipase
LRRGRRSTCVTLELNPDIATRENDDVDSIWDSLSYEAALVKAKVPVEFHSYAEGGHAFGLRTTKYPATAWPLLVETWLHTIGIVKD